MNIHYSKESNQEQAQSQLDADSLPGNCLPLLDTNLGDIPKKLRLPKPTSAYAEKTDLDLVEACRQEGDQRAFEVLIQRYERPLYNFILRMISNPADAEELFQETFLRIYQNINHFRGGASFSPWAYRIAHNICIDKLRSPRKRLIVSLEAENKKTEQTLESRLEGKSPNPEDELYRHELGEEIQKAVQELPEKLQITFVLYQYKHLSYEQISTTLAIPIGTVKSRMHAALKQLSHHLRHLRPAGSTSRSSKK